MARKRLNLRLIRRRRENRRRSSGLYGGERGIRTPGAPKGTTDFESAPFDHSGISPRSERTANLIRRIEAVLPAHIGPQGERHGYRPVRVLVVLENRDQGASDGE